VRILLAAVLMMAGAGCSYAVEPTVWEGDSVPPPEIVESSVDVGVYIFPGWYRYEGRGDYPYRTHDEDSEWRAVAKKPAPRPLLGFYDDSMPEVNDWHIKWALEHGISFFCFDWYWNAGEHRLMRTLERGFLKAKYCDLMKFCIHWCNHGMDWQGRKWNRPLDEDFQTEALVQMAEYCADNYFKLPNYLTVDGRPVFVVWDFRRLITANGGPEGFIQAVEAMNEALHAKGFKDIYLVAMGGGKQAEEAGFDAMTGYGYYGTDYDSKYEWRGGYSVPYEDVVTHYETTWKGIAASDGLPYILSIGSNWDNRPRAGKNAAVITGKSPEKFAGHCRDSLKYIDKRLNMAIIEAWNEWGEGSFIEPDKEWGFGFLDAVREVFTDAPAEHVDYVPGADKIASFNVLSEEELAGAREMEKQPYPDPPRLLRTVKWEIDAPLPDAKILKGWEFDTGTGEGWQPYHVEPFTVADGILSTTVTLDDPQLIVDNVGVAVDELGCIALRLKTAEDAGTCELFWSTTDEPNMSAGKAFRFRLERDGDWHTYQVFKKPERKWSGTLKTIRLDLAGPGNKIEMDWVRFYGRKP